MPSAGSWIANATDLTFTSVSDTHQSAHASRLLGDPSDVQLVRVTLATDEIVTALVDTAPYGGGFNSYLRIFEEVSEESVREIASNDNFRGRDAHLTFQASSNGGVYYIGVSSFDNTDYDPLTGESGTGSSFGLFDLHLSKDSTATAPGLVSASVQVSQSVALWGDWITVNYTVENRSSQDSESSPLFLVVAANNQFDDSFAVLQETTLPALAGGQTHQGSFNIQLGESRTPLPLLQDSQKIFLGLQIGSEKPFSPAQGNDWHSLQMLKEEDAAELTDATWDAATSIDLNSQTTEASLDAGNKHLYQITLTQPGNLTARVEATAGLFSLTLFDEVGRLLVQSHGQSAADFNPQVVHGLNGDSDDTGTTYFLKVTNLGESTGTYRLTSLFAASASMLQTLPVGASPAAIVRGDFNGDGVDDVVTANLNYPNYYPANNVTVFLGHGDGTFKKSNSYGVGLPPEALVAADFNGDGRLDLAATNSNGNEVAILLGRGDGAFQDVQLAAGASGIALVAGDFNGDGAVDLASADRASNAVDVLLGNGDGTFDLFASPIVAGAPSAVAIGDFNEDGLVDLAVTSRASNQVTVLQGDGTGDFQAIGSVDLGVNPVALVTGHFNEDSHLDLASANLGSNDVTVLFGDGQGGFHFSGTYAVGDQPTWLVTGDFDGDGRLDLGAANSFSNNLTILLGQEGGLFLSSASPAVGGNTFGLVTGNFNGDARVDLAAMLNFANKVTVLLGNGNGVFPQAELGNPVGQAPDALVSGDFNGDGRRDLATANRYSADTTVLLGLGDGTFTKSGSFTVGSEPRGMVEGDFNGDGRPDIATANYGSGNVSLLLGNGDGIFHNTASVTLEGKPAALIAGFFDEDKHLDLAVAIKRNADFSAAEVVQILLGDGRGGFQFGGSFTAGGEPVALVAGDFDGDGDLDLASGNFYYYSRDVTVLLGNGDGTFQGPVSYPLGSAPIALVTGHFDGDTALDIAVVTRYSSSVVVLLNLNDGSGTFQTAGSYDLGDRIESLTTGDFNGDGLADLIMASTSYSYSTYPANNVTVLLGDGQGNFTSTGEVFPTGPLPASLVAADFNGDGRLDLASANQLSSEVTALLGSGTGDFFSPVLAPNPVQSTPLVANFSGQLDTVVLTQTGQILFRRGLESQPGVFAPPVVLNPGVEAAARDLALVQGGTGETILAALSANTLPAAGGSAAQAPRVMFFGFVDDAFTRLADLPLPADFLPASIASADLDGDGRGDLVITEAASDRVLVSFQSAAGFFEAPTEHDVGVNPSDVGFAQLNDDGAAGPEDDLLDIVITNRFSGQVSVLLNEGGRIFSLEQRFRAGTGLYGLTDVNGAMAVQALEGTSGLVVGEFDANAGADVVVANSGTSSLTLLSGDGRGGFFNPTSAHTVFTEGPPIAIVADHILGGEDTLDLAVLTKDSVWVYQGDGLGGFSLAFTFSAGNQPTGLTVDDVTRPGGGGPDGVKDLIIGNAFGDLLILAGDGSGGFTEYRRANQRVSLAVARTAVVGQNNFFFSNQASDQLAVQSAALGSATVANPEVFEDRSGGIQAPGPQTVVTVGDTQYLVVVNSGSNSVLIYTLDENGLPDPESKQTYFTGTDPVGLTVTNEANDLNQDGVPDVVIPNQGSNDVSIFIGKMTGDTWTLSYRPRQSSGGLGPTSVAIEDVIPSAGELVQPDLLVSNGQSNSVSVLSSLGDGFFLNEPTSFQTGIAPSLLFVGNFDGTGGRDLVTINTGSHSVTLIANFLSAVPFTTTIATGGTFPVAAAVASVNADGINDLLVGNMGNGALDILLGGPGGFQLATTVTQAVLPNLSDLALVTTGNAFEVYGAGAGRDLALLLATFGPAPEAFFVPQSPGFSDSASFYLTSAALENLTGDTSFVLARLTQGVEGNEPALPFFIYSFFTVSLVDPSSTTFAANAETKAPGAEGDAQGQSGAAAREEDLRQNPSRILLFNLSEPQPPAEPVPAPPMEPEPEEESVNQVFRELGERDNQDGRVDNDGMVGQVITSTLPLQDPWRSEGPMVDRQVGVEEGAFGPTEILLATPRDPGNLPRARVGVESVRRLGWRDLLAVAGLWSNYLLSFAKSMHPRRRPEPGENGSRKRQDPPVATPPDPKS